MQTYVRGYTKVVSSKDYDIEVFSETLKPFENLPLIIEDCRINLDGIEFNVCTKHFDLAKFMNTIYLHSNEVIGLFTKVLAIRSLTKSPMKEKMITEIKEMVDKTQIIGLDKLACNNVIPSVQLKSIIISGKPFIMYSSPNFKLVLPTQINANLSCFVNEVSQKLQNTVLRFTVDPFPMMLINHHAILTIEHEVNDTDFYLKIISFIKNMIDNKELLDNVLTIARSIKEIEDREIYFEFRLKALVEEIETKLKEMYNAVEGYF